MLLLLVAAWWGLRSTETSEQTSTPPDGETAPRAAPTTAPGERLAARGEGTVPMVPVDEAPVLHVWLRPLHRPRYIYSVPSAPFDRVWPERANEGWDLEQLDGYETSHELRRLSHGGAWHNPSSRVAVLDLARTEGFLAEASWDATPEEALVALYASWLETEVQLERAWKAFHKVHAPPGMLVTDLEPDAIAELFARVEAPSRDTHLLRERASEVAERWPDHPVADHARLALVRASMPNGREPEFDAHEVARLVRAIDSPEVREQAVVLLTEFDSSTAEELLDVAAESPRGSPQDDLRVTTWALNRAVKLGDWDRASQWSRRLRAALDRECSVEEPHFTLHCDERRYELRDVVARLVALEREPARTWREALTAAVWRCHLEGQAHAGTSRSTATWDGEFWRFDTWDHPTETTACMGRVGRTDPAPEGPLRVPVVVEAGAR